MATPFFTEAKQESGISGKVMLIAASAVVLLVALVAVATLHHAPAENTTGADSYSANVIISGIELSEATNGAGGKVTYIDGIIKNNGPQTLRGATVRVIFKADDGSQTQAQTTPLTLVRTRVPYVDLEPMSAEPLLPGQSHAFRLIFETVPATWNEKEPTIRVGRTELQ